MLSGIIKEADISLRDKFIKKLRNAIVSNFMS